MCKTLGELTRRRSTLKSMSDESDALSWTRCVLRMPGCIVVEEYAQPGPATLNLPLSGYLVVI